MLNLNSILDFESYYIVKHRDNLWKIASKFEVTSAGIQQFQKYILILNPFLTEQMKREPGDLIYAGDIIMVHSPDYTYQNFLYGDKPFPSIPMKWQKRNVVQGIASKHRYNLEKNTDQFDLETFFEWYGYYNNGLGGISFDNVLKSSYDLQSKIRSLDNYLYESLGQAKKGLLDERSFRNYVTRELKEISTLSGNKLENVFKSYKEAMKNPKSIVGNLAKRTYRKEHFSLPRKAKQIIDMKRTSEIITSKFEWKLKSGKIIAKTAYFADIGLRIKDIIMAYRHAKKDKEMALVKEAGRQYTGYRAALVGVELGLSLCVVIGVPAGGWPAAVCGFIAGGIGATVGDFGVKYLWDRGEQSYDALFN